MKNLRKYGLFLFFIQWSFCLEAQELIFSFLDKHGKDDKLEIVTIGKTMLGKMNELPADSEDLSELKSTIKGLENIYIVTSKDTVLTEEYYDSSQQLLENNGFSIVFANNEDTDGLFAVGTKGSKRNVEELALLFLDKNKKFNLILMTGVIDIDTLVKYSENLKQINTQ